MADERIPLVKEDFGSVSQSESGRSCGCSYGPLTRICKKRGTFSSSLGVMLSMLGCVVGTGNIWRFPRIMANHSTEGGALSFLIVWACFLWLWSIPIILIEYGVGRYTRKSVIESFGTLIGPAYRFMGGFPVAVGFCIASYYAVLVGWCGYYFIWSCANSLPESHAASREIWDDLQGSNWPVLCHGLAVLFASLAVSRGVSTIEPVNNVVVPLLLLIIVFCFYWALSLPYASEGIIHMFSPSWETFKDSDMWLDALSQNAWDTGAGVGTFLTYATYMKRTQGAVKLGTITPFFNNIVSILCGILLFCTVFSVRMEDGYSNEEIVGLLKENGPANTGLTFIWMPVLFGTIEIGRFLAVLFFLCLTLAGLSSLIALMELSVHCLNDFGIHRIPATIIIGIALFSVGLMSALDQNILVNQDSVWGYAMIVSGCFYLCLVYRYGIFSFRNTLYNKFGIGDWPLPWVWVFIVIFLAPVEGLGLIGWWIVDQIVDNPHSWWEFHTASLAMVLSQWAFALLIMIGLNWWMKPLKISPPSNTRLRKILGFFFKYSENPTDGNTEEDQLSDDGETVSLAEKDVPVYGTNDTEESSVYIKDVQL